MAAEFGLLIDYEYCSNCGTCIVACQEEHDYPVGKYGIRVYEDGPWQKIDGDDEGKCFNWNNVPVPTDLCDLCADRRAMNREPTCVHHCQADVIRFGTIAELAKLMAEKPKQVMFAIE